MEAKAKVLHPLSLIIIVIWLGSMALICKTLMSMTVLLSLNIVMVIVMSNDRGRVFLYRLYRLMPLLLMVFMLQILFRRGGNTLWSYGWLRIDSNGIYQALMISLRFIIIISCAAILSGLSFVDFRNAFACVRLPEEISFMVAYVIRFVVYLDKYFRDAQKSLSLRGIRNKNLSLRQRLQVFQIIAVSTLADALSKSQMQAIALELRGFRSLGKRTELHQSRFGMSDMLVLYMLILLSLVFIKLHGGR